MAVPTGNDSGEELKVQGIDAPGAGGRPFV